MAPGRRRGGAEQEGGSWRGRVPKTPPRPGASSAESPGIPGRPVARALNRRPARQVIVRPGAKGVWKIAADPCVLARRPPDKPRSWGARVVSTEAAAL